DIDTDPASTGYLQVIGTHLFCGVYDSTTQSVRLCPDIGCGKNNAGFPLNPMEGWVHPLKHADMMMDGSTPILVGVNPCPNTKAGVGQILRVSLHDGSVSRLSA